MLHNHAAEKSKPRYTPLWHAIVQKRLQTSVKSHAVMSDCLGYTIAAVATLQAETLIVLKHEFPVVQKIHYFF